MAATTTPENTELDQAERRARLWEVVGWVGVGMVVGTVLLTVWALWRWENADFGWELLALERGRSIWQLPLLMAVIVAVTVFFRDRVEPNPDPFGPVNPPFYGLLVGALATLLLVLWYNLPQSSFVSTSSLFDTRYLIDSQRVAYWGISVSLLVGLVLMLISHRWPRTRPWRCWLPSLAVGVVLALLVGSLPSAVVQYQPTKHSRVSGELTEPAPVPERVTRVGWTWEPPEGVGVRSVEPGTHGPIVVLDDGVVALYGSAGEELWSFRHPRSTVEATVFAHAGLVRVVRYPRLNQLSTAADRVALVTDLDMVTGEIVERSELALDELEARDDAGQLLGNTPELSVYAEGSRLDLEGVVAREGVFGEELWTYGADTEDGTDRECETGFWDTSVGSLLLGDQILLPFLCADPAEVPEETHTLSMLAEEGEGQVTGLLVSLDLRTGERNWSYEWPGIPGSAWIRSAGPVANEGAHPLVEYGIGRSDGAKRLLDPRDGTESVMAPEGMNEEEFHAFDITHADTGGMVIHRYREDGTLDLRRVSASGEVVDVAEIPADMSDPEQEWTVAWRMTVLEREVLLPGLEGEHDKQADWGARFVLTAPFGQDGGGPASQRIPVGEELGLSWNDDYAYGHLESHLAPLPLPGAVVVHTTNGEGTHAPVHGLVP